MSRFVLVTLILLLAADSAYAVTYEVRLQSFGVPITLRFPSKSAK
jgi:hypothetical protein